jgi:hypothetical protein
MPAHEIKSCPRCGNDFECCVSSINNCQCSDVTIEPETAEELTLQYGDCLCRGCLEVLAVAPATTPDPRQNQSVSGNIRYFSRARRSGA